MKALEQSFYLQDGISVARNLLGKVMIRVDEGEAYCFKIVETEAYMGIEDKGAHVFGDKKTERTAPLYEIGGTTYIYLIYGMYHCLNIAAHQVGVPHCVLIRAVEPLDEKAMAYAKSNRPIKSKKIQDLTNGPGKLCKALKIDKSLNAKSVIPPSGNREFLDDGLWIVEKAVEGVVESIVKERVKDTLKEKVQEEFEIVAAKRINIPYAEEYQDKLWRFYIKNNAFVSVR